MKKVPQTKEDLLAQLNEQIELIRASALSYDAGHEIQAKQLALRIRVLVHDTKSSKSLLGQLGLKDSLLFFDTDTGLNPAYSLSHTGLVAQMISVGPDGNVTKYVPNLDKDDYADHKRISFDKWWNKIVIKDQGGNHFSRKDLTLEMSDTDGGAHVDEGLREDYVNLTRNNSTGWIANDKDGETPLLGVELASVRTMAEEVLRSLEVRKFNSSKIGRNDICPCGSGKKFKRCCDF